MLNFDSVPTVPTLPAIGTAAATRWQPVPANSNATTVAAMEMQYFQAVSLYRRRNYEKCVELCTTMLRAGHESNVQMFTSEPNVEDDESEHRESSGNTYTSNMQRSMGRSHQLARIGGKQKPVNADSEPAPSKMPSWLMEGIWQLKMRALTQRVYVDDLETNDDCDEVNEEVEFERIATAARPGTSIKNFIPRPKTSASIQNRLKSAADTRVMSARPTSGMARPGTNISRPGSSLGNRPASRCGTASRVRATSAAAYRVGDATASLYQASRLNPTIYAERQVLVKALFQFLFYHESEVQKAYSLCEAVIDVQKQKNNTSAFVNEGNVISSAASKTGVDWWWYQQIGRCLLALKYPRKAESYLQQALIMFPHPDTYLLLSRLYQRLEQPNRSLELINTAVDKHPFDLIFRTEQARIYDMLNDNEAALQIWRLIAKLNPINVESLACIALSYFYDNNPEMALMYYRRILSLGVHSPELYCNIALCCLYGGQIDLVLPCFQRALVTAKTSEQKSNIWYNLSFVAITTGDFNLARRCLQLCLTSDARNGAALNNLAVLSAHAGDLLKSKSYLTAAKEVLTDSLEIDSNIKYMEAHYKL